MQLTQKSRGLCRLQTVSWDIVWFIMVFVSLLFLILPPCVVLQNDRDVHIFSVSWYERFLGVFFSSGPESDSSFPGSWEHWHQTLPGELNHTRPDLTQTQTHLENTELLIRQTGNRPLWFAKLLRYETSEQRLAQKCVPVLFLGNNLFLYGENKSLSALLLHWNI